MPLALWPAVGALAAWNTGENGALALALAGVVLSAVPAVLTLLGVAASRKVAEGFALAGMVIGVFFVLRNGVTLTAIPAVGYFVVYAFLSHERFRGPDAAKAGKPSEPPPAEHPLAWLKENVEAIAVAFIMALVIRCFCVEVFKIPSSSMEPTLLGDSKEHGGDRIMVTKLTYGLQDVARFEPVVFKFPLNPMKNYIKRVVGLPGEKFMIDRGNIYTIPDGSPDRMFRIRRKSLRTQRSIWIPAWSRDGKPILQTRDSFEGCFRPVKGVTSTIRDGALVSEGTAPVAWTAEPIDDGHFSDGRGDSVNDILFDADLELKSGQGRFWIRIEHDLGPFELTLSPAGNSALTAPGRSLPLKTPAFPAGRTVHLEFMVFDGQAFVLFDGRIQAELIFQETHDQVAGANERDGLRFGAEGQGFRLSQLRVAQDIYYKPRRDGHQMTRQNPLPIPPGKYFMLGDNVNNSHDGRAWIKYTVKLTTGEVVEFESQAEKTDHRIKVEWARRHGREQPPHLLIEADRYGHERALYPEDIARDRDSGERFHFVDGRYIIGRAFAVCWPMGRALRLIR